MKATRSISTAYRGRTTLYKGIRMRSRLEALAAQAFDRAGEQWEYEPRCYASDDGQYLPDFLLPRRGPEGEGDYVEVKPASFHREHLDALMCGAHPLQARMQVIYASDPRAFLIIWFPELNEAFVSGWWEPGQWYHQGPWLPELAAQYMARREG